MEEQQLLPAGIITACNMIAAIFYLAVPGFYGNYWYWRKFQKAVRQAASEQRDHGKQMEFIRVQGGTSYLSAGLLMALFAAPVLWATYWANFSGHVIGATGPLTVAEIEANFLSRMDQNLTVERRACVLREIDERVRGAGDPKALNPAAVELLQEDFLEGLDPAARAGILKFFPEEE